MRVIPAIDLLDGRVVRLQKGDYEKVTVYNEHPLGEAEKFRDAGFEHIHVVDLDGAREGRFANLDHILTMIDRLGLSVQTGGGIRSYEDALQLLKAGVSQVICSSMAVKNPDEWLKLIGDYPNRVILGMDLKEGSVAYGGWTETLDRTLEDFLQPMIEEGLQTVLSTDISRDGMLEGPNFRLYRDLGTRFPHLNFIASGGVARPADLSSLSKSEIYGVVVGRAYYEQNISLHQMKEYHEVST